MKKTATIIAAMLLSLPLAAQRRGKATPQPVQTATIAELMEAYDFSKAEELLEKKIAELERKKQPAIQEKALLETVRKSQIRLHATEQVTFIDSMILPKDKVLEQIKLSEESGSITSYSKFFKTSKGKDCTLYLSELGNRVVYSEPDKKGHLRLMEKSLIGGEWSMERKLNGFNEEENDNLNFPFMLADGITMYYAAECDESIGGYDIFMTRYDAENQQFLAPENIGMPFNSPANDYLMVIDEFRQLGWFVTDRGQPADKVCLYTFIPTATRRIYNVQQVGAKQLAGFARIASIKDTWKDMKAVNEARQRLAEARDLMRETASIGPQAFTFVVNDSKTYHNFSDFQNQQAQQMAREWLQMQADIDAKAKELAAMREKYAAADQTARAQMKSQILLLESTCERLSADRTDLEKEIRRLELKQ